MTWNIGLPPQNTVVALVVRKWVACESGLRTSFLARDPVLHISALGQAFANQEFEPTQTVRMGSLVEEDGELIVLDEDGDMAGFEASAILAWCPVPSFALDQAAAAVTDQLIKRVSNASH